MKAINGNLSRLVHWALPRFRYKGRNHPGRLLLAIAWRLAIRTIPRDSEFRRSLYNVWLLDRPDDLTYNFCLKGSYGFVFSDYLRKYCNPFIFLDIGANVGLYSLLAAQNENCLEIHAFEPDPDTGQHLLRNAEHSGANIALHPVAVTDKPGRVRLHTRAGHSGVASLEAAQEKRSVPIEVEGVSASFLDDVVSQSGLEIVCKIDVEGHELSVLSAIQGSLAFTRTVALWVEVSAPVSAGVDALLGRNGFSCVYRSRGVDQWDALYIRA